MRNYDILLPVMDETYSLKETVDVIMNDCALEINKIIIIVSPKTNLDSISMVTNLISVFPDHVVTLTQNIPGLGGALRNGFAASSADYVVLMASDLETDPHFLIEMISLSKKFKNDIIAGNRWIYKFAGFKGYGGMKFVLNFIFQKFLQILFGSRLMDFTYGYRVYPSKSIDIDHWISIDHSFLLESLLTPLRNGYTIREHPVKWKARSEGESHIKFKSFLNYVIVALRVRFKS
jgi:glycosyltransferase involved in cell wall biosynthesis